MKNYKVYLIRNKVRDIVYVGMTKNSLKHRYDQHCYKKKLNKNEHSIELVQEYLTIEQSAQLERMLIAQYNLTEIGLNNSKGSSNGFSVIHSDKTKQYLSQINKGKRVSEEHAAKNRIARLGQTNGDYWKSVMTKVKSKPVMCIETGIIYKSVKQAAKELNLHSSRISEVCSSKRKSTGGLHFIFHMKQ